MCSMAEIGTGGRIPSKQARNTELKDSLNTRQVELEHAQANLLAELSAVKLSRGDFDSAAADPRSSVRNSPAGADAKAPGCRSGGARMFRRSRTPRARPRR